MTSQEQVNLLQQSVALWNKWREEHPSDTIDLSHTPFVGANLSGANLSGANLNHANLNHANLNHATLMGAYLIKAHLSDADLSDTGLKGTNFSNADLSRADFSSVVISPSSLVNSDFNRFYHGSADLTGADLTGANLSRADLEDVNLSGANLSGANLSGAHLNYANLSNAIFKETRIRFTSFEGIDMRTVRGLETVIHDAPSTIGIDTLVISQGDIPEVFLRGAGVPDTFITYAHSLVQHPIEYYSSFISYSSKDEAFAKRLYADLQSNNVRCWFAPEDMKIGDKIRPRIDETIRLFDKLLLVLSKDSIASNWVAYEVEKALNKEPQGIANVLFPIRIDDTILTCNTQWAQDIKHTRHIGDFSRWKDHDTYQQAFTRLLRDLKAESRL